MSWQAKNGRGPRSDFHTRKQNSLACRRLERHRMDQQAFYTRFPSIYRLILIHRSCLEFIKRACRRNCEPDDLCKEHSLKINFAPKCNPNALEFGQTLNQDANHGWDQPHLMFINRYSDKRVWIHHVWDLENRVCHGIQWRTFWDEHRTWTLFSQLSQQSLSASKFATENTEMFRITDETSYISIQEILESKLCIKEQQTFIHTKLSVSFGLVR